jgi:hypothetical protein
MRLGIKKNSGGPDIIHTLRGGIISIAPGFNPGIRVSRKQIALHAALVKRKIMVLQRNAAR